MFIASDGLAGVAAVSHHARSAFAIVRQKLVFSMVCNVGVLGLTALGTIPLMAAAATMLAGSISINVVENAARPIRFQN